MNAQLLARRYAETFRYIPGRGWYVRHGGRWRKDTDGAIFRAARDVASSMYWAAWRFPDAERAPYLAHAYRSEKPDGLRRMVELAESLLVADASTVGLQPVDEFLRAECVWRPEAKVPFAILYSAFTAWCDRRDETAPSAKAFARELDHRGISTTRTAAAYLRTGIELRESADERFR